jgi:hypothetical protein
MNVITATTFNRPQVRIARILIVVIFLALIRTIAEMFRLQDEHVYPQLPASADVCFRRSDGGDRIAHNGVTFFLEQTFDDHIFRRHNVAFARIDQGGFELNVIWIT